MRQRLRLEGTSSFHLETSQRELQAHDQLAASAWMLPRKCVHDGLHLDRLLHLFRRTLALQMQRQRLVREQVKIIIRNIDVRISKRNEDITGKHWRRKLQIVAPFSRR